MITITAKAAKEIQRIIEQQQIDNVDTDDVSKKAEKADAIEDVFFLRVGVRGGGCSGFQYSMDLTNEKAEDDNSFDDNGINIICDPKSYLYLQGLNIDFKDDVIGQHGFVFENPNASNCCHCGNSFSCKER